MPTQGKSLVGFMDQVQALDHLRNACIPPDPLDAALIAVWQQAQANLGPPTTNAGYPDIQSVPSSHAPHVAALLSLPWASQPLMAMNAQFAMVEIDPLLAFQFTVCTDRSSTHCNHLSNPATLDELFHLCLPHTAQAEQYRVSILPQSVIVKSNSLNLRTIAQGINATVAGIQFGFALPFAHVVRFAGRCYLHNGFHRAYGARMAGATHIPCIFRDVADPQSAGIMDNGGTFPLALLESNNPPTVGHFTSNRAQGVSLRAMTRILHVSWADYAMPDE